ncbi:MAG: hypothetical protein LAO24_03530 [Acidobacteriia bacterium]|nr:hypothetical protein [Terriglobia bacterium]
MATVTHKAVESTERTVSTDADVAFAPASAQRLLIFGGIALIAGGMLFGDIFAVFVLHQNGRQTGEALLAAAQAVSAGNASAMKDIFGNIGGLLENRGTKVDAHVHMTDAGYLALLLALVQPYVALSQRRKKLLANLFVAGGILLPVGIFLIHYVGLAYSPFPVIGWGSVLADSAGALLIVALTGQAWGFWNYLQRGAGVSEPELPRDRTWAGRALLTGGTVLLLLGFLYGAWYAGMDLYSHEARETQILNTMLDRAISSQSNSAVSVGDYGSLAAERAIKIAAHSHVIEFGLLAMLLSFVQPYVYLGEVWKRRWVMVLLAGSVTLPVFVLLEVRLGLLAGGIADLGGLLVIVALGGMLVGVLRHGGRLDAAAGSLG